jgi:acetyl esterase/lipase
VVSTVELLRDDGRRMAAALKRAGVPVALREWRQVPSMWHLFAGVLPEARDAIREIAKFIRKTTLLDPPASESLSPRNAQP